MSFLAKSMYYFAIMAQFMRESPQSTTDVLVAGEFQRGRNYTNWRSQGTNDWLLIFTVKGGGRVVSGNSEIMARRGTVTLYQPHTPQYYFTDPDVGHWHLLWSHFHPRPHWRAWLNWPERTKGLRTLVLRNNAHIRNISAALTDTVHLSRPRLHGSIELASNALERAILWINSANLHRELDERVRKAADLLAGTLHEPFSLTKLAKECGLSVSRLAHLFREQMGASPQKYQEQLRLLWAGQLLRSSGLSVTEIAADLGYASPFYFSKRFKTIFGKSPSHYRSGQRKGT